MVVLSVAVLLSVVGLGLFLFRRDVFCVVRMLTITDSSYPAKHRFVQ